MYIVLFLLIYLIGSIPTAVIVSILLTGKDIRTQGSGNSGATNVFRVLGAKAAIPVLIIDFSKSFLPVFFSLNLASLFNINSIDEELLKIIFIVLIIIGHAFPVWAQFKGGKGVASAAGGISALFPPLVPLCLILFTIIVLLTKYVSLASIITSWSLPLFYFIILHLVGEPISAYLLCFFIFVPIAITILHRKNIKRLIKGEEKKLLNSKG